MRNSKFLKCISYVLIPFLVLVILLSALYAISKDDVMLYNSEEVSNYFESDAFLSSFMSRMSFQARRLIFDNERYSTVVDRDIKICYYDDQVNYYRNIKDFYFLIIYKNLALTNVELTTETNSVEKIKTYIFEKDAKKANFINGKVEADSELIEKKAIQYFDSFENSYYTIENENIAEGPEIEFEIAETYETGEVISESYTGNIITPSEDNTVSPATNNAPKREYYDTTINDFEIYTTYAEELVYQNEDIFFKNLVETLRPYEMPLLYAMPVCGVILFIILIYLIIAIGHTKGKEEIDLNDLDKIPIEILLLITLGLATLILGLVFAIFDTTASDFYNLAISVLVTGYFIGYVLCAISAVTIIKRIKAKVFWKTSLTGKVFLWSVKIIRKILNSAKKAILKIKNALNELTNSLEVSVKYFIYLVIYVLLMILLILCFKILGILLDLAITGYLFYKFIERVNSYKKIEEHLKEMYEGKEINNLLIADFAPEFKDIIIYINDISNGFENAKEEGAKSERMKTELITNVSHDIKTPLTSIINYVDLLKKENIKNGKAKEYIDVLDQKSQRLKKLTEDLVEASKASSGNIKLDIEKINILELIKQTTGEFEDRFKDKKLEIISNMPKEEVYINADPRYMYRIIENLFSNISKYALDSSRVYIDVKNDGVKVRISFKNISKDKLNISAEELMQRFVRGDKSRTTEGSGLGLSISQSLTELQKGIFTLNVDGDLFKVELEFNVVK